MKNIFIMQLSEEEQNEIKAKLETYAKENDFELEIDEETGEYVAMLGRLCDIEDVLA